MIKVDIHNIISKYTRNKLPVIRVPHGQYKSDDLYKKIESLENLGVYTYSIEYDVYINVYGFDYKFNLGDLIDILEIQYPKDHTFVELDNRIAHVKDSINNEQLIIDLQDSLPNVKEILDDIGIIEFLESLNEKQLDSISCKAGIEFIYLEK